MPEDKVFQDGEILTADRLNAMRTALSDRIDTHDHTGGTKGPKLGSASLQDQAVGTAQLKDAGVTQAKLDPALYAALKDGPTTTGYMKLITRRIGGNLIDGLQGALVDGVQSLAAETKGLQSLAAETAGLRAKADAEPAGLRPKADAQPAGPQAKPDAAGMIEAQAILQPIEIIVNPIYQPEWTVTGSNISVVYRQQSQGDSTSDPSVIHIEFAKAYTNSTYTVMLTPEWSTTAKMLFVVRRDPKFVELTVQTGKYADLKVNFSLVIFGALTP